MKWGFNIYLFILLLGFICECLPLDSESEEKSIFIWLRFLVCFWPPKIACWIRNVLSTQGRWHPRILQKLPSQRDLSLIWNPPKTLFYVFFFFLTSFRKQLPVWRPSLLSVKSRHHSITWNLTSVCEGRDQMLLVWEWTQQYGQWQEWNVGMNPKTVVTALTERCRYCLKNSRALFCHTPIRPVLRRFSTSS